MNVVCARVGSSSFSSSPSGGGGGRRPGGGAGGELRGSWTRFGQLLNG